MKLRQLRLWVLILKNDNFESRTAGFHGRSEPSGGHPRRLEGPVITVILNSAILPAVSSSSIICGTSRDPRLRRLKKRHHHHRCHLPISSVWCDLASCGMQSIAAWKKPRLAALVPQTCRGGSASVISCRAYIGNGLKRSRLSRLNTLPTWAVITWYWVREAKLKEQIDTMAKMMKEARPAEWDGCVHTTEGPQCHRNLGSRIFLIIPTVLQVLEMHLCISYSSIIFPYFPLKTPCRVGPPWSKTSFI